MHRSDWQDPDGAADETVIVLTVELTGVYGGCCWQRVSMCSRSFRIRAEEP